MGTTGNDEAQRELEREALRNVRGLVERIEAEDREGNQKQVVAVVVILLVAALLAAAFLIGRDRGGEAKRIELPLPSTKPVAK